MIPTLSDLETLARGAGEILRAGYGRKHSINFKSLTDPVTEIDHQSEAYLLGEVRRNFPGDRIVAEESGQLPGREANVWHIDPLDGTVNFSHGIPIFSVSIGYQHDGSLYLGVVYDPLRDECFTAQRGQGAWLNGEPIRVSGATNFDHSLLVTGFPYDVRTNPNNNLDNFSRFSLRSQAVRRLGSAALDLCYVAAGRFEGYWEGNLGPWDVAAGCLIAEEAGARVTTLTGDPNYFVLPLSIIAATPAIHPFILQGLQEGKGQ